MFRFKPATEMADLVGVALSALCVLHCLALPIVIVVLPSLGFLFDAHWVHQVLIGAAVPVSAWAVYRSGLWREIQTGLPMATGLLLLGLAAFYKPMEPLEAPVSILGASLLAFGHYRNTRLKHQLMHLSNSRTGTTAD